MQDFHALEILEAGYDLSVATQEAIRAIAQAMTRAVPRGPIMVACFDSKTRLAPSAAYFERASSTYMTRCLEWHRRIPDTIYEFALSLTPRAALWRTEVCELPLELKAMAQSLFPLRIMANTGNGGVHIVLGDPDLHHELGARIRRLHDLAHLLAIAFRIRAGLQVADLPRASSFAHVSGQPGEPAPEPAAWAPCQVLRHIVLSRERDPAGARSTGSQPLWPALIAGRWSLLDAFTHAGSRYFVAHENPAGAATLRALSERERAVLQLALAGHSGKWTALDRQLSESAVTRTLGTALRRVGAPDIAMLAGAQTAMLEPLDWSPSGVPIAIARVTPAKLSRPDLSDAERAIVARVLDGKGNAAIASERGTSLRTVAHQIASAYRKLGVSSRRELFALLA
jgi:DNA-binding CsgD family transcriptional regulator